MGDRGVFPERQQECGLNDYQVRRYPGWHRHITLAMAAHACLTVLRAAELEAGKAETDPPASSSLSLPELRRLITRLAPGPRPAVFHVLHWSTRCRRRQHQARICHYKRRGHTPPEPKPPSHQKPLQYWAIRTTVTLPNTVSGIRCRPRSIRERSAPAASTTSSRRTSSVARSVRWSRNNCRMTSRIHAPSRSSDCACVITAASGAANSVHAEANRPAEPAKASSHSASASWASPHDAHHPCFLPSTLNSPDEGSARIPRSTSRFSFERIPSHAAARCPDPENLDAA